MSSSLMNAILYALLETLYMVGVSGAIAALLGIPLGVLLSVLKPGGLLEHKKLHRCLNMMANIIRSIPFIILVVAIIPLTRLIVGTSIGDNAAIVPLALGAIPFVARIVENALQEIHPGLIEAGQAMGASPLQIIIKILLPEALANMINGMTLTLITLVGYSAMAGVVGAGGLGYLAISYGYQRFDLRVMIITVVLLVVLVQVLQTSGDRLAKRFKRH
jgi:D-methionine transport system permease protein